MTATVIIVFALVYLGMILGGLPFFQLDRTGVALLGAIVLVASGDLSLEEAVRAFQNTVLAAEGMAMLAGAGVRLEEPATLFVSPVILSNVVSNVPAVMLLLPAATHPMAGTLLAQGATLARHLFIVGSIASIIVVDVAGRRGVRIDWRRHAGVGIPVTLASVGITGACLALRMA